MPRLALTDRFIAGAKPESDRRASCFDSKIKGLELLVSGKTKTFYAHYVAPSGKRARLKLGTYPGLGLAEAKTRTIEIRREAEAGADPRLSVGNQPASMTVASLIASYLDKYVRPNLRSASSLERRFAADVVKVIGAVRLADLHRRDINRVIDPIVKRGSLTQARLVFTDIRGMVNWAVKRGDIDRSMMTGMSLPSISTPRVRVLNDDEIKIVWASPARSERLGRRRGDGAEHRHIRPVLRLCLATGQRLGEITGLRRDELDLKARMWRLPGSRTKNKIGHGVSLSGLALDVINETLEDTEGPFLFPDGDASLSPAAVAKLLFRNQYDLPRWSAHDLRRTALTGLAQLGVQPVVIAHIANHQSVARAGVTFAHYVKHGYEREMREAMDLWSDRLAAIVSGTGAYIVPMVQRG